MNKILKSVLMILLAAALVLSVCACHTDETPKCTTHTDADGDLKCDNCGEDVLPAECKIHTDGNNDGKCDKCGETVKTPQPPCVEHIDADEDEKCDNCGADVPKVTPPECTEHVDADEDEKCDNCGADVPKVTPPECTEHVDANEDEKCDNCGADVPKSEPDPDKEYTLTFESQGVVVGVLKIKNGEAFAVPALDRGDEYILLGWKIKSTGTRINTSTFVWTEDITLVAVWDKTWSDGF